MQQNNIHHQIRWTMEYYPSILSRHNIHYLLVSYDLLYVISASMVIPATLIPLWRGGRPRLTGWGRYSRCHIIPTLLSLRAQRGNLLLLFPRVLSLRASAQ